MTETECEVGIIGGGPGGAASASYLAQAGITCVVFEREVFPRPHVGESLVPASTRVMREIGFLDEMDAAGFVRKYGAVWTAPPQMSRGRVHDVDFNGFDDDCNAAIRFGEREQPGVDRNYTWHVDRGRFDSLLLQHARKLGATIVEGATVRGVNFSDPNRPIVEYSTADDRKSLSCRVVIDASGRRTLLGNQLKLKVADPVFNQFAIHSWFDGYDRNLLTARKEHEDYIFIHFLPVTNTWIWQIPISKTVTSIGVVTQKKNFEKSRQSRERFFWDCIGSRPELLAGLRAAQQVHPLKEEGDYSYSMRQVCGAGFVMIGDAARFVDPIFSSGVSIALNSARLAAADIVKALEAGSVDAASFQTFESTMRRGTKNWHEFITLYYRLNVLFTLFVQNPKYRLDVLKLLQGDLYDEESPAVLTEMRRIVTQVERNPEHLLHAFLGDLTNDAFKPAH